MNPAGLARLSIVKRYFQTALTILFSIVSAEPFAEWYLRIRGPALKVSNFFRGSWKPALGVDFEKNRQ
jgi:hypothetical protein